MLQKEKGTLSAGPISPMRCPSKLIACLMWMKVWKWHIDVVRSTPVNVPEIFTMVKETGSEAMQKQTLHSVYRVLLWCCLHCSAQLWYGIYQPNWSMLELRGTVLHALCIWRMAAAGKEARKKMHFLQPWSWAWLSVVGRTGKGSKRELKGGVTFSKHELVRTAKCKVGMPLSELEKSVPSWHLDWNAVLPALKVDALTVRWLLQLLQQLHGCAH